MSTWIEHAIFWHIYPLGFVGAEKTARNDNAVFHRLERIEKWLDYAVNLGVSGLILGPVFASSTHGYDTIDHFRIDPRLGDDADFDHLVDAARQRGLRIVLDGVFNHVGRDFPAFRKALSSGGDAPEASWFHPLPSDNPSEATRYATFEGHDTLITLNHDNPAVADYVCRVMDHWLDRGVSGWRLDAAYAVPRPFWAQVLPRVREKHPDAVIFGEVIHGNYSQFVRSSTVDSVTQYELWKAIWSSLNDRNFFELAWALERHNKYLKMFAPFTFVGNHDVTRLASKLATAGHIPLATALLLTLGGTPCIYAGDEQAFHGIKEERFGGDDAIRPAFPETPDELAPFGWGIYQLHQRLIAFRRRHPWLHRAHTAPLHLASGQIALVVSNAAHAVIVALNADETEAVIPVPDAHTILEGDGSLHDAKSATATLHLPACGWAILSR